MGRHMTVVLKSQYKTTQFIESVNQLLSDSFGANIDTHFIHEKFLQEEANYMNTDPEGLLQLPHFPRPITVSTLASNFFWFRIGEFTYKLSGSPTAVEARDAVAVCKWIIKTKRDYIDTSRSENFSRNIVATYLNPVFADEGYDLASVWKI
jgi:hypothetical protein